MLARKHDERMKDRSLLEASVDRPVRHALEVRHPSYEHARFVDAAAGARHRRWSCADTAGKWPMLDDVTASDFVYVRLHGAEELYVSGYDDAALDRWAGRIETWHGGRHADRRAAGRTAGARDGSARCSCTSTTT